MQKINNFKSNQLNNDSDLSIKEGGGGGISALLRSEKKVKCFDRNTRVSQRNSNVCNYEYVTKMFNEAIQLKNSIEIQSLFSILLINFNNKYLAAFECEEFPNDIPQFSICYKYFVIMVIPLIFLHKDETIYKNSSSEAKNIFESFICVCIENVGQKNMSNKKIDSFIDEYKKTNNKDKINIGMEECCIELIKIIFKNYKVYSPLKKATEQLLGIIKNESIKKIISVVNNTILYCFNHKQKNSFYLLDQKIPVNRNKSLYKLNQSPEKDLNKPISTPTTPFIRCAMKKDFCLVLDIDETIVHSMNLPFGNYFLLRPGVIHFLEELSKLYEIIIFTCSPKIYADGILNKIDIDNNYISHRLYKDHVIFEKGKSVKKLNMIGRDLNKIIFVDNMKSNAKYNLQNLCHVSTWIYDINDEEIINLETKLKNIATNNKYKDDIRKGLESL
jgi:Dullard-like phosphatase family protein